jgi:hypothetical protein
MKAEPVAVCGLTAVDDWDPLPPPHPVASKEATVKTRTKGSPLHLNLSVDMPEAPLSAKVRILHECIIRVEHSKDRGISVRLITDRHELIREVVIGADLFSLQG